MKVIAATGAILLASALLWAGYLIVRDTIKSYEPEKARDEEDELYV